MLRLRGARFRGLISTRVTAVVAGVTGAELGFWGLRGFPATEGEGRDRQFGRLATPSPLPPGGFWAARHFFLHLFVSVLFFWNRYVRLCFAYLWGIISQSSFNFFLFILFFWIPSVFYIDFVNFIVATGVISNSFFFSLSIMKRRAPRLIHFRFFSW